MKTAIKISILIVAVAMIGFGVYFLKPDHKTGSDLVFVNKKAGYSFEYTRDAVVVQLPETPNGACVHVAFARGNATTSIGFIDNAKLAELEDTGTRVICGPTDAPMGVWEDKEVLETALADKGIVLECNVSYFHPELYDDDSENDMRDGKFLLYYKSEALDMKRCYFDMGDESSIKGYYEIDSEYGVPVAGSDAAEMEDAARKIISSFSFTR